VEAFYTSILEKNIVGLSKEELKKIIFEEAKDKYNFSKN